jgi:type II secretory pathway pseudopilin PulG
MMLVLAVIAILAAVFTPMYVQSLPGARLKAAARTLAGDLRLARSRAVASDTPYFVCFGAGGTYQIDRVDDPAATDCSSASTPTELTRNLAADYPGVVYGAAWGTFECPTGTGAVADPVGFPSDRAVFNAKGASVTGSASGAPVQTVGTIYLTNPDTSPEQTYCVEVLGVVGNIQTLKWSISGGAWGS